MAYRNIDPKSPAGKAGFRFGTRGNKLVYVHCGKPSRIIQQLVLAASPTEKDHCLEFVACPTCFRSARIASPCEKKIQHTHFGLDTIQPNPRENIWDTP